MFSVQPDFLSYSDGVYQGGASCVPGPDTISHALLVIGFGTDGATGQDFWVVQNSWGTSWGQGGFGKVRRGVNTCGLAACATYPVNIVDPENEPNRKFQLVLHDTKSGAMCLDGSPSGMYYSKGFGSGMNKTIIYFQGGGWCAGLDKDSVALDCINRAKTNWGSTG